MDQIQREKVAEKLKKIKALAERGVGGEKETAMRMYEDLKDKYSISDEEVQQAAAVPVDITQIDLKQYWGIAFQMATAVSSLQEELDFCNKCPYSHTEDCEGCGTHENIKELQTQYEEICSRLAKTAMEM